MTPLMITAVYTAGKRWGAIASGLLIGLPLTSGPISLILACQYGADFAARSAAGNLAGQVSICLFCLAYYRLSQSRHWLSTTLLATLAFLVATAGLDLLSPGLLLAFALLLLTVLLVRQHIPARPAGHANPVRPWWDLPSRILIAVLFVFAVTSVAGRLGPVLSGLIAPFPIFAMVFAAFTHRTEGSGATANLLRGIVQSSIGYAAFFLTVGLATTRLGIPASYLLAVLLAIATNVIFHFIPRCFFPGKA